MRRGVDHSQRDPDRSTHRRAAAGSFPHTEIVNKCVGVLITVSEIRIDRSREARLTWGKAIVRLPASAHRIAVRIIVLINPQRMPILMLDCRPHIDLVTAVRVTLCTVRCSVAPCERKRSPLGTRVRTIQEQEYACRDDV